MTATARAGSEQSITGDPSFTLRTTGHYISVTPESPRKEFLQGVYSMCTCTVIPLTHVNIAYNHHRRSTEGSTLPQGSYIIIVHSIGI